jgi:PIN domain nuclease of toxin-antitoxin system
MNLLLDTHAFIWWDSAPDKLSAHALSLCESPENQLFLSVASLWEIQIKMQLGKLKMPISLQDLVLSQQEANGLTILSVQARHTFALGDLTLIHRDPFDRMIVVQAKADNLCIISQDAQMRKYPVAVEW